MIKHDFFLNQELLLPVIIGAILIWSIFLYKELPLTNKIRFISRLSIATIVILVLALIILVPLVNKVDNKDKAIVLTDNYSEDQLDSLKTLYKTIEIVNYSPNQQILPDSISSDELFVLGNGIFSYDFWQLQHKRVKYIRNGKPAGIKFIDFPYSKPIYSKIELNGMVHKPSIGDRVVLEGPDNTILDSIVISSSEDNAFSLGFQPKVSGKFLFSIIEKDSIGKVKSINPLPLIIEEPKSIRILMLNAFPTFESKYLKNFLADNNHHLVSRIQLTRGRFKYEYFNTPKQPIDRLDKDRLAEFDIVISDRASIENLSASESELLDQQIREAGLGLFLLAENDLFNNGSSFYNFQFISDNLSSVDLKKTSPYSIEKYPYSFKSTTALMPIHKKDNTILTAYYRNGIGKIGSTAINTSYGLILKGQDSIYRSLWTDIVSEFAKDEVTELELNVDENLVYKDEPMGFKLRSNYDNPILMLDNDIRISLRQDYNLPFIWRATTYPKKTGWQFFKIEQDTTARLDFYVFNEKDWESMAIHNRIKENELYFTNNSQHSIEKTSKTSMNLSILYILALLGLGYLWLVPKLGHSHL